MSFANYRQVINGQSIFSVPDVRLLAEPDTLIESARLGDTITYCGNATYPISPPSVDTLAPTDTSFKTLFSTGFNIDDYLRIRPEVITANYPQLANIEYSCLLSASCPSIDLQFVVADPSLNIIQTYQMLSLDTSGTGYAGFTIKGFSVDYPDNGLYAFIQGRNPAGTGTASFTFKYANSNLTSSIDTSVSPGQTPSRPSTNVFGIDTEFFEIDLSGASAIISALQSDVANLQAEDIVIKADITTLSGQLAGKLNSDGTSVLTGGLEMGDLSFYPGSGFHRGLLMNFGAMVVAESQDSDPSFCPAISLLGDKVANANNIYFYSGNYSGNQRTGDYPVASLIMDNDFQLAIPLQAQSNVEVQGNITQTATTGVNSFSAPINANFGINMNGNGISNLLTPTLPGMGANKQYVDTQDATKLSLNGSTPMTGALNMNGFKVQNGQTPTIASDLATKGYVDGAVNTGGFTGIPLGALQIGMIMPGIGATDIWFGGQAGGSPANLYVKGSIVPTISGKEYEIATKGWLLCNGASFDPTKITTGTELVNTLGGTNVLPNLTGNTLFGSNNFNIGSTFPLTIGQQGGSLVLTTANLPSHTHTGTTDQSIAGISGLTDIQGNHNHNVITGGGLGGGADVPVHNNVAVTDNKPYGTTSAGAHQHTYTLPQHTHTFTTSATGGGTPYLPSCMGVGWFIYTGDNTVIGTPS
jgi:hypothetical protein